MKPILAVVLPILLVGAALFLLREPVLLAIGDFLVVQDELQQADVIHVIAGEDDRTEYAVELYHQGYGGQLFFTGGWCTFHNYYHGQHARQLALGQGVPSEAIAVDETRVTSTYSEAVRLREFIGQTQVPIHSVIIVSDPHHMRRARWTYRRVLGNQISVLMAHVPFELSPFQRRWWTDAETKKYVKEEYAKTIYYIARYQFAWGPLKEYLASLDPEE